MKTLVMSLSVFSLVGCGASNNLPVVAAPSIPVVVRDMPDLPDDAHVRLIASEFYADAQSLQHALNRSVKSISFVDKFDDGTTPVVGRCYYYNDQDGRPIYREVNILRSAWNTGSDQFKKTLLYHELGHCALSLDHVTANSGAIMEPNVLPDEYAANLWLQLVHDEFKSSTVSLTLADTIDDITHVTVK